MIATDQDYDDMLAQLARLMDGWTGDASWWSPLSGIRDGLQRIMADAAALGVGTKSVWYLLEIDKAAARCHVLHVAHALDARFEAPDWRPPLRLSARRIPSLCAKAIVEIKRLREARGR